MARPIKFAGQAVLHRVPTDGRRRFAPPGATRTSACEACHGAARGARRRTPTDVKPEKPDPRKTCVICHTASISKPKTFPQVDPAEHAPEGPCTECHVQPHSPKIS